MIKYLLLLLFPLAFTGVAGATTINVSVGDNYFSPVSFDASIGDTIIWTLDSSAVASHSTTSTSVPTGAETWDYIFTGVGDSYAYEVAVEGVYEYHCQFHSADMRASFSTAVLLPFHEDFSYPPNYSITSHGWVAHSEIGINPTKVSDGGLSFPGYPSSEIGNAAILFGNSEDDHRLFESQTTGSIYMGFMVNVADKRNGYFIHLGTNPFTTDFRGKIYVGGTNPNLEFGLSFSVETPVLTSNNYNLGTTYLLILKYDIVEGANNDTVSLYVFDNTFPMEEPSVPTIGPVTNPRAFDINPGAVSLRKYSASENLIIDGIRIAKTWIEAAPVELLSSKSSLVNFELAQNYPNPFNPATRIDYSLPASGNVKLTVYNVLGQEIAVLVKGIMQSGNHSVEFNASHLNSGLYFYKLESNGVSLVKKMMLLK